MSHEYKKNNTYNVTLTVTDKDGDADSETEEITVTDTGPIADFSPIFHKGHKEPLTVEFKDKSASYDGIKTWQWNFGDGKNSILTNPTHIYEQDGKYTLRLTVTEDDGSNNSKTFEIEVEDTEPVAKFQVSPDRGKEPLTVKFEDKSESYDGIDKWMWDFGDGKTSEEQNPTHEYKQDGTYMVTLTVVEKDGDTASFSFNITVENTPPVVNFTYDRNKTMSSIISFEDKSTSNDIISSWLWDFGDGSTSKDKNPTHEYKKNDSYEVSLKVTENDGDYASKNLKIEVETSKPVVRFEASPEGGEEPLTVEFKDKSESYDGIDKWIWDFGDGKDSGDEKDSDEKDPNPTHEYKQDGTYTVTLTVVEVDGDTASYSLKITVEDTQPVVNFSYDRDETMPSIINFEDKTIS
ncbi:MAG: PKD domain-containing protein [Desulfobacterales bacterium]|nr:PKD domain-containing protein [Desulfobacterales bacterium]